MVDESMSPERRKMYELIAANPRLGTEEISRRIGKSLTATSSILNYLHKQVCVIRKARAVHRAYWVVVPGSKMPEVMVAPPKKPRVRGKEPHYDRVIPEWPVCELAVIWTLLDPALQPPLHRESHVWLRLVNVR